MFKVWQLPEGHSTHSLQQPVNTIQTIASVSRIKWRPKRPKEIASVAMSFDLNINIWEVRRPFIPIATFQGHKDVVTST